MAANLNKEKNWEWSEKMKNKVDREDREKKLKWRENRMKKWKQKIKRKNRMSR